MYMQELTKNMWTEAGKNGLILALVSASYLLLTQFTGMLQGGVALAFIASLLNLALWGVKFWACIYLMNLFLKKMHTSHPDLDAQKLRHYGYMMAILSAIVYAGCVLVYYIAFIPSEMITDALDLAMSQNAAIMDEAAMDSVNNMIADLPQIMFFYNLIYCFLFGAILSRILVSRIIPSNPFAQSEEEDDD